MNRGLAVLLLISLATLYGYKKNVLSHDGAGHVRASLPAAPFTIHLPPNAREVSQELCFILFLVWGIKPLASAYKIVIY